MSSKKHLEKEIQKLQTIQFLKVDDLINYFKGTIPNGSFYQQVFKKLKLEVISPDEMVRRTSGQGLAYTDGENIVLCKYEPEFFFEIDENKVDELELSKIKELNEILLIGMGIHEIAHNRVEDIITQTVRKGIIKVYDEIYKLPQNNFQEEYLKAMPKFKEIVKKEVQEALKSTTLKKDVETIEKYFQIYLMDDFKLSTQAKTWQNMLVDIFIESGIHLNAQNSDEAKKIKEILELTRKNSILKNLNKLVEKLNLDEEKINKTSLVQTVSQIYIDPRFRNQYMANNKFNKLFDNDIWINFLKIKTDDGKTIKEILDLLYQKNNLMYKVDFIEDGLTEYKLKHEIYSQDFNYYSAKIVEAIFDSPELKNNLTPPQQGQDSSDQQDQQQDQQQGQDSSNQQQDQQQGQQGQNSSGQQQGQQGQQGQDSSNQQQGQQGQNGSNQQQGQNGQNSSNQQQGQNGQEDSGVKQIKQDLQNELKAKNEKELAKEAMDDYVEKVLEKIKEISDKINESNNEKIQGQQGQDINIPSQKSDKESKSKKSISSQDQSKDGKETDQKTKLKDKDFKNLKEIDEELKIEGHKKRKDLDKKEIANFEKEIQKKYSKTIKDLTRKIELKFGNMTEMTLLHEDRGNDENQVQHYLDQRHALNEIYVKDKLKLFINLLLDGSGSMGAVIKGSKDKRDDITRESIALMKIILEKIDGIFINIYNFTTAGSNSKLQTIQDYTGIDLDNKRKTEIIKLEGTKNLMEYEADGGTPLYASMIKMVQKLKDQQRKTNGNSSGLLFIFSDGEDSSGNRSLEETTQKMMKALERDKSIKVVLVGIEDSTLGRVFGQENFVQIKNVEDFTKFFLKEIEQIIDIALSQVETVISDRKMSNYDLGL